MTIEQRIKAAVGLMMCLMLSVCLEPVLVSAKRKPRWRVQPCPD